MSAAIAIDHISHNYGEKKALADITISVNEGELFGLIGPDGAGKTTLFKILVTLLKPLQGKAQVLGLDVIAKYRQIRRMVGYMPGRFSLYPDLSVEENLAFFAAVFDTTIQENYDLVEPIYKQLEPFKTRKAGQLSGGMKQKLALCCALIHKPAALFLDEPTTGVDAISRKEFWQMLQGLKAHGLTILVSTPYMDEASLCERIAFMDKGSVLAIDTPANIVTRFTDALYQVKAADTYKLIQDLRAAPFTKSAYAFGEYLHVTVARDTAQDQIQTYLAEKDTQNLELKTANPGIEDTFMALMGHPADNGGQR